MHVDNILPKLVVEELREDVKAADVEARTRAMVRDAWNRESPTFGTTTTIPSQPRPTAS
jgi:hypothetical protein